MSCTCSIFFNNVFFFSITEWNQIIFHIYVCKYLFPICLPSFLKDGELCKCYNMKCGFQNPNWIMDKTMCGVREFLIFLQHLLTKKTKNEIKKRKGYNIERWVTTFGFYTWLTKGSVDGSPWLVESVDLDFSETPVEVEMTPWVS